MLIESACSVERVEEALSTLLSLLPDIHYFRFNPGRTLSDFLKSFMMPINVPLFYCWVVKTLLMLRSGLHFIS